MRNVWDEQLGRIVEVADDDPQFEAPVPRPKKRERRMKHVIFFDKATRKVVACMESSEDHCDIAKIQAEHHRADNPIGCRVLKAREFQLPRAGQFADAFTDGTIPEDLKVDDIDEDTGRIRGKYANPGGGA